MMMIMTTFETEQARKKFAGGKSSGKWVLLVSEKLFFSSERIKAFN